MKLPSLTARCSLRAPAQAATRTDAVRGLALQAIYARASSSLSELQRMQVDAIASDLNSLVSEAYCVVMRREGQTDSSAAYYRNTSARTAAAKLGNAVQAETYALLNAQAPALASVLTFGVERATAQDGLPNTFRGRPDIRMALGDGKEAIFDLTSAKQAEQEHAGGRDFANHRNVLYYAEISYGDYDQQGC